MRRPWHNIQFEIDFGTSIWSEGWRINWFHLVQDFSVWTAGEGAHGEQLEWRMLDRMTSNVNSVSDFTQTNSYFRGRWFRVEMTKLYERRVTGPGKDLYCASIREVEVVFDTNLARLHPTNQTYELYHPPNFMIDNDYQTFWSSPPGFSQAVVMIEFTQFVDNIAYTKIAWNYKAESFLMNGFNKRCGEYGGRTPPSGASYVASDVQLLAAVVLGPASSMEELRYEQYSARCLIFEINPVLYYDQLQVQIREIHALPFDPTEARANVTVDSTDMIAIPLPDTTMPIMVIQNLFDGDDETFFYTNTLGSFTMEFPEITYIFRISLRWAKVFGTIYAPQTFATYSSTDGENFGIEYR